MALPSEIATETVTRLRGQTLTDSHRNSYVDWTDPDRALLEGVSVQGELGTEDLDGRDAVIWVFRLFVEPWHDVAARDRIETVDGQVFDVDGPIVPMRDTTGQGLDHKMGKLTLVEG